MGKKGQPGPLKAKVHASRTKQMVLMFFDAKGIIAIQTASPNGKTVNPSYIRNVVVSSQDW
jgi:hypothetical protein